MKTIMNTGSRLVLGAIFFIFGLNGFFQFIPQPALPAEAGSFMGALFATGYFFPFLKTVEVVMGGLLLANLFVPLALTVLAPIIVNITLFHLFLAPAGLPIPIVLLISEIYLTSGYWHLFKHVLASKAEIASNDNEKADQVSTQPA